jgi:redox-sensitive bicupin YhaK (pirin superfamily)
MSATRKIEKVLKSKPAIEGAGVHLNRAFGFQDVPQLDPFLLLDDFHADDPAHYLPGFPWHPHRGIETITYVFQGSVEHGDSMGNRGLIHSGDVQWMTAGSGIVHQEMPKGDQDGVLWGVQLWANLPASHKMMDPRYRDVASGDIPSVTLNGGVTAKIICGELKGEKGPVQGIVIDPEYLDVAVPPHTAAALPVKAGHRVFAYVLEGKACFDQQRDSLIGPESAVLFGDGDELAVSTSDAPVRFLLLAGKPLREPVAWGGPIVMNTREELRQAFQEYQDGTFLRSPRR